MGLSVVFFVVIPLMIYTASYFPYAEILVVEDGPGVQDPLIPIGLVGVGRVDALVGCTPYSTRS